MSGSLLVAVGSALGGVARYAISGAVSASLGAAFPWGTLAVNVTGSLAAGIFAAAIAAGGGTDPSLRHLLVIGFCGGYTTFSAVSLQTLELARYRRSTAAIANVALSVALCLVAVWLGCAAGALLGGS